MKKIFLLFFIASVSGVGKNYAQTKQDMVEAIRSILSEPEMKPVFQVEMAGGKGVIIRQEQRSGLRQNEISRQFETLSDSDFYGFRYPVKVMTSGEIGLRDQQQLNTLFLGLTYQDKSYDIIAMINLGPDRKKSLRGLFLVTNSNGEWVVERKSVQIH